MPTKLPTRHKVRHEKSVRVKETKSRLALRPSSGRSVARRGRTRRPIDALCHNEREGRVRDEKRGGEMPVTMNGSPFKLKHDHWKEKDAEIFFGHELSSKQRRAKAEAEFQARQTERLRQEEVHRAYEKQKRDEMTAKLEKRLEFQPGARP